MILNILEHAPKYFPLNKYFLRAFNFLTRPDLKDLPVGRYEIFGDRVYVMISKDNGRKREDAMLETHKKYIDIQLILEGTDNIGWKPASTCKSPAGEYDKEKDVQFFIDAPDSWITTQSGSFAIFFPEDAHMPMISSAQIHKAVIKVKVI